MCGISALVSAREDVSGTAIEAMTQVVRHRGPDGEGYVAFQGSGLVPVAWGGAGTPEACFGPQHPYLPARETHTPGAARIAFGHRRLSIVDLSPAGHQPMSSSDGSLWIVYNGEIYNHIELREELSGLGHSFRSHSDTEVLLAAYAQWGHDCLSRLNGMFAFALLDRSRARLFAARDRFGVKPLYWWKAPDGTLALASEIKQFTALHGWGAVLNRKRAYDFLHRALADHGSETMFDGVRQLRGGECMEIDLRSGMGPRVWRWYELVPRNFSGDLAAAAAEFRRLFEDSVRIRLRADVSVGSCLSGGLDSSSIVCVASRLLRGQGSTPAQKTFSARSREPSLDEGRYIDEALAASGAQPHFVYPELDDLEATLGDLTWHQDEPFGSTSIYAQWKVFALAGGNGCKVMLDGQGADEALAGYSAFYATRLASLLVGGRFLSFGRELAALRALHGYRTAQFARHMAHMVVPAAALSRLRSFVRSAPPRASTLIDTARLGVDELRADAAPHASRRSVRALSLAQLTSTNLPMLLHWEDRNSMAHSVESRLPFLDYRLVEHVVSLPADYLIEQGITKRVLRHAMQGVLPEPIRNRTDKIGFATPEEAWMRRYRPGQFVAWVGSAVEKSGGILKPGAIKFAKETVEGTRPFSFQVWRLISFGAWMDRFAVRA